MARIAYTDEQRSFPTHSTNMAGIDMDDFDDFMSKVEQVDQAVKGLASGEIHPDDVDDREAKMHEEENKAKGKRQAARNEKMKTVDEKKATEVKISSTSKTITMS